MDQNNQNKPLTLADGDRAVLSKKRITRFDHILIPHLWEPFTDAYVNHLWPTQSLRPELYGSFRYCARMMLDLNCTYWAFTWDRILPWRDQVKERESWRPTLWKLVWDRYWSKVTAVLYFLRVLPYKESIYKLYHMEVARKWLGEEWAKEIQERFVEVAKSIGYQYERQIRLRGASVLLAVTAASEKRTLEDLDKSDFAAWEAQTTRSPRVASSAVTMAQRVLGAMGYLKGAPPRLSRRDFGTRFTWGRTAPAIVATFQRFLNDLASTRRPSTMYTYVANLRRFGDWLGTSYPDVLSVANVHRHHIEAYKQAVNRMSVGDYVTPSSKRGTGNQQKRPFSFSCQNRCISCVKAFFEMIEVLEYPESPKRKLFLRGDVKRVDHELPRFIPDAHWHRFIAEVERLTVELVAENCLPLPYERTRAILGILVETGLRAGELCRLDTGCIITVQDTTTGQATYWLRVPTGKLHNDRVIPIRPALVEVVDAWMRKRGPQPLLWDERTNKLRDFLFTLRGGVMGLECLNHLIAHICAAAGIPRYTSHQFRHTLAVQWRKSGMRIETISQMLGHKSLRMTLRYAAIMPETVRREFDAAFAAIDQEHRTTSQVRIFLSAEAHLAASQHWREALWVDLGIGFCGLSAYIPCDDRLACLPCPNFVPTEENLPLLSRQRDNLIEISVRGERLLPPQRKKEIDDALQILDQRIADISGQEAAVLVGRPADKTVNAGD